MLNGHGAKRGPVLLALKGERVEPSRSDQGNRIGPEAGSEKSEQEAEQEGKRAEHRERGSCK